MKETTTVAYRCPDCGVALINEISLFSLSSGELVRRCSCGESVLRIQYLKSRDTVSLDVPCIVCPKSHPYQVAAKTFFGNDTFILQCTDSGLDVLFVGDKDEVIKAVEKNTEELRRLFELIEAEDADGHSHDCDCGCHDEHAHECDCGEEHEAPSDNNFKNDEYEYFDAVVTSGMLYLIKELADDDKINCPCGKKELILDVGYDVIEISCDACQARVLLRSKTDEDIISLAERDSLELN